MHVSILTMHVNMQPTISGTCQLYIHVGKNACWSYLNMSTTNACWISNINICMHSMGTACPVAWRTLSCQDVPPDTCWIGNIACQVYKSMSKDSSIMLTCWHSKKKSCRHIKMYPHIKKPSTCFERNSNNECPCRINTKSKHQCQHIEFCMT